ncbi:MAG: aspartate-semialdehyde dehydrogenase [Lachnospirales bacterium]
MKKYNFAIVGVTGLVGRTFLKVLEEKNLPIENLYLLASKKSAGSEVEFMGKKYIVEELTEKSFDKPIDFALFSAGSGISKNYAPIAAKKGIMVIDNSSAWRMDETVPLIVPEVNIEEVENCKGIIANPNCSTIQAVVALKPLHDKYKIKRIVYSTYQSVSGAGKNGQLDLERTLKGEKPEKFQYPIANNCLPQIDVFCENGDTFEEQKMINETRKILKDENLKITATAVRVPVMKCHGEAINVEFYEDFDLKELVELLKSAESVVVQNDIENLQYPLATECADKNDVYVGRIRRDESVDSGINMWVVADNIRKGAATNAVQIAEKIIAGGYSPKS